MIYVLLLAGLLLLIKSADFFVGGSSSVTKLLRAPTVIIGLTTVAFRTGAPELAVSISTSLSESNDIAVGNVISSSIFDLLVMVGAYGVVIPMAIGKVILYGDYLLSILTAAVILTLFAFGHTLSRLDSVILLLLFAYFLYEMMRNTLASRAIGGPEENDVEVLSPARNVLFILGGLAAIMADGSMVVSSANPIAFSFDLSETLIGLTVVTFGTSLPELVISVAASGKGENGLALGDVIGSNLFNILSVLAISATISPMKVDILSTYNAIFLIAASIITWFLAKNRFKMSRREGIIMMSMYVGYTAYIIMG